MAGAAHAVFAAQGAGLHAQQVEGFLLGNILHQHLALGLHAAAGQLNHRGLHSTANVETQRYAVGTLNILHARELGKFAAERIAQLAGGRVDGRDVGQRASQAILAAQCHLYIAESEVERLHHEVAIHDVGLNFLIHYQNGFQFGKRGQVGNLRHHLRLVQCGPHHVKNPFAR